MENVKNWEETKHPRDEKGRFTEKDIKEEDFINANWLEIPQDLYYSENKKEKIKFIEDIIYLMPFKNMVSSIDIKQSKQSMSTYIEINYKNFEKNNDDSVGYTIRVSDHKPTFNVDDVDCYIYFDEKLEDANYKIKEYLTPKIEKDFKYYNIINNLYKHEYIEY